MAATGTPTPNIGLRIPLGTDPASVDDINYNSNLIDTKLGAVGNDSVQDQIDDLNSNISTLDSNSWKRIGNKAVFVSSGTNNTKIHIVPSSDNNRWGFMLIISGINVWTVYLNGTSTQYTRLSGSATIDYSYTQANGYVFTISATGQINAIIMGGICSNIGTIEVYN